MIRSIYSTALFLFIALLTLMNSGCASAPQWEMIFEGRYTRVLRSGKAFTFKDVLREQLQKHSSTLEAEDILKLCFQAAYGPAAQKPDPQQFFAEFAAAVPDRKEALFEVISPDFIRVDLRAWKKEKLPAQWLFNMSSATEKLPDSKKLFRQYCTDARKILAESKDRRLEDFDQKINWIPTPSLRHSRLYLEKEKPAYCLVSIRYLHTFEVLKRAAVLPERPVKVIALDGRAASGKTTLARQLSGILQCGVVHMDDFFLPPELRSRSRYQEPGGNVHYERFIKEVLPHIRQDKAFSYRKFDCSKMKLGSDVPVRRSPWRIVEGAYSLHPKFGDYADLKLFYDIRAEEQMRRILKRNGKDRAVMFQKRWIPLEESYLRKFKIKKRADLILGH